MADKFAGTIPLEEFLVRFTTGNRPVMQEGNKRVWVAHVLTKEAIERLKKLKKERKIS